MAASADIVVLDDFFPHEGSTFRYEEFSSYLDAMPDLAVYSSGAALHHADETRSIAQVIDAHVEANPGRAGRVNVLARDAFPRARLYYAVFLHVIAEHLDSIESVDAAFVFTLYPGGGFALDQPGCDALLRRVFDSPCFRHVVATQALIRDYLIKGNFCRDDQVTLIYGGVCPRSLFAPPPPKQRYGFDKPTLDLCFVANRYTPIGADKGYDLLVEAATRLADLQAAIRVHVVGRFDPSIIDLGAAAALFTFYGLRPSPFFREFYVGIDAIVSPTRANVLYPGAFDGFPTGCSVEAGLHEVAVVCTDPLALNTDYTAGRDLVVVPPSTDDLVETIMNFAREPGLVAALGKAARARMLTLFSADHQVAPRIDLLRRYAPAAA